MPVLLAGSDRGCHRYTVSFMIILHDYVTGVIELLVFESNKLIYVISETEFGTDISFRS
jgi:hypothetical protein